MLDFSFGELALIVVVAVVFIGPKELPAVVAAAGKAMRAMRGLTREIRQAFEELSRESGIKDTTDTLNKEMRLIKGNDGSFYESHDISHIAPADKPHDG